MKGRVREEGESRWMKDKIHGAETESEDQRLNKGGGHLPTSGLVLGSLSPRVRIHCVTLCL